MLGLRLLLAASLPGCCAAVVACSGIEVECLQEDMLSSAVGSACRPLAEGAGCGFGKRCNSGFCRGGSVLCTHCRAVCHPS
jgi:hypothetical protein